MDKEADALKAIMETIAYPYAIKNRRAWVTGLRGVARGLWNGTFSQNDAGGRLFSMIDRNLRAAWNRGFREAGIMPDEQAPEDRQRIFDIILDQSVRSDDLLNFISENKKGSGKWGKVLTRLALWEPRYDQVYNEAKTRAKKDRKLEWQLGIAEHCSSCKLLNGQVRRASFWNSRGILPAVPAAEYLECKGYKCKCKLVPTSKPITRGRFPSLP